MKGFLERQLPNEASMLQDLIFVKIMRWAEENDLSQLEILACAVEQGMLE